jgi:hypothetical protein
MTKGQIEFLIAMGVIVIGVSIVGLEFKANHNSSQPVKPIANTIVLPNGTPPTPTLTSTPPDELVKCDVLTTVHVNMPEAAVRKLCGAPDIIDSTSAEVKRIEKIFKADEIWYYLVSKATVEITDGFVTKVSPMTITQDPLLLETPSATPTLK